MKVSMLIIGLILGASIGSLYSYQRAVDNLRVMAFDNCLGHVPDPSTGHTLCIVPFDEQAEPARFSIVGLAAALR